MYAIGLWWWKVEVTMATRLTPRWIASRAIEKPYSLIAAVSRRRYPSEVVILDDAAGCALGQFHVAQHDIELHVALKGKARLGELVDDRELVTFELLLRRLLVAGVVLNYENLHRSFLSKCRVRHRR